MDKADSPILILKESTLRYTQEQMETREQEN